MKYTLKNYRADAKRTHTPRVKVARLKGLGSQYNNDKVEMTVTIALDDETRGRDGQRLTLIIALDDCHDPLLIQFAERLRAMVADARNVK